MREHQKDNQTSVTQSNLASPVNELVFAQKIVPKINTMNRLDWSKLKQPTLDTIMRECEPGEDPTFRKNSVTSRMEKTPRNPP